jgi:hypothetical protein
LGPTLWHDRAHRGDYRIIRDGQRIVTCGVACSARISPLYDARTKVGHLQLVGELEGRRIDHIVLDTGAANTVFDVNYCQSEGIPLIDTGKLGGGGVNGKTHRLFSLGDARLMLDGMPIRSDGILAMDLSHTNEKLLARGSDPMHAILGQDVLRNHQAVIDYGTLALFLKKESA